MIVVELLCLLNMSHVSKGIFPTIFMVQCLFPDGLDRSEDHDYNGEEQWEVTRVRGAGGPYRAPPSGAYQHNDWGAAEYQPGPRDIRDW